MTRKLATSETLCQCFPGWQRYHGSLADWQPCRYVLDDVSRSHTHEISPSADTDGHRDCDWRDRVDGAEPESGPPYTAGDTGSNPARAADTRSTHGGVRVGN